MPLRYERNVSARRGDLWSPETEQIARAFKERPCDMLRQSHLAGEGFHALPKKVNKRAGMEPSLYDMKETSARVGGDLRQSVTEQIARAFKERPYDMKETSARVGGDLR